MAIHPQKHVVTSMNSYLFDTNVWILLLNPLGNQNKKDQTIYSDFFSKVLAQKSMIIMNSLLLSEYANACLKMDFLDFQKGRDLKYKKDYCGTNRHKETSNLLMENFRKIEIFTTPFSDEFNLFRISDLTKSWGKADFNDCYIHWYSKRKKFKLVTNDKDFLNLESLGIEVITSRVK